VTALSTHPSIETHGRASRPLAIAGIAYVSAWAIGLAVQPSGPALDASGHELARHYADNGTSAAVQSILVHGIAAVALFAVTAGVARAGVAVAPRAARLIRWAGASAAVLSAVQMAAGLLAGATVDADDTDRAANLFEVVSRVDGLKMLALAVMAAAGVALARRAVLPHWLARVGYVLVVALVPAAVGYLSMSTTLAPAAAPALLLLLVWVCGAGVTASRR